MNRAEEVWEKALDAGFAEQERGRDGTDAAVAVIATVLAESRAQGVREMRDAAKADNYEDLDLEKTLDALASRLLSSAPPEADKLAGLPFRAILNWFMCSDLWPASEEDHETVTAWIEFESQKRGYKGWVEAYHEAPR